MISQARNLHEQLELENIGMNLRTLSLSFGLTVALAVMPAAHAVQGCGNANLSGNFAMQFSGNSMPAVATGIGGVAVPSNLATASNPANAGAVPVAGIAHLYLDGNGNLAGNSSLNLAGSWLQSAVSGTYTVNSDCTVALAVTDSSGATENFSGVIVGNGQSIFMTQTDAGAGVSGTAKIQSGACQTSNVTGTFGFQTSGTIVGTSSTPYSATGVISLDGQGDAAVMEWRTSNGASSQAALNGSVTINSDCTATLSLTSQADNSTANYYGIVLFDQMQTPQFLLVQSDAGTAVTGLIVAQ
jgi:hypothetical protein